jgi:hypothetical protein
MIANYRAPLDKYTLGFPAGLLDGQENVEVSGLRELKERWQGKVSNQIQADIERIINNL